MYVCMYVLSSVTTEAILYHNH